MEEVSNKAAFPLAGAVVKVVGGGMFRGCIGIMRDWHDAETMIVEIPGINNVQRIKLINIEVMK